MLPACHVNDYHRVILCDGLRSALSDHLAENFIFRLFRLWRFIRLDGDGFSFPVAILDAGQFAQFGKQRHFQPLFLLTAPWPVTF